MALNVSIWLASLANINAGIITVIWSATPLFQAIADRLLFGDKLKYNHWIGMLLIFTCSVLLGLQSYIIKDQNNLHA